MTRCKVFHRRLRFRLAGWIGAAWICSAPFPTAHALVNLNVARVGFPTLDMGAIVRYGMWAPIIIDVDLNGEPSFDGLLRVGQYDTDGDVAYDSVPVHLQISSGGSQRYQLYMMANTNRNDAPLLIELRDEEGKTVEVLCQGVPTRTPQPAATPQILDHDSLLILSMSTQAIGRIAELAQNRNTSQYEREPIVGHMNPSQLPEHWLGLEAVDILVWDEAQPAELTPRQLDALVGWIRQGGTLLVTASQTAGQLRLAKDFYPILPVDLGDVTAVDDLPELRQHLLDVPEDGPTLPQPISVVGCTLRRGARTVQIAPNVASDLLTERRVGRGRLIFFGVTLNDFFSGDTGSAVTFFRKLFHLRLSDGEPRGHISLFGKVVGAVAFSRSAGRYLFIAALFSLGYTLLATLGTWWFLGRRGARHHAWTAFAIVGAGASVVSILMVQWQQGLGDKLHQLSVIDMEAGNTWAFATTYFGLKTSSDRTFNVWLPADPIGATEPGPTTCLLRPIPAGNDLTQERASFIDPTEYGLIPNSAEIRNVRLRATLKQFEGRWDGFVGGTIMGNIVVRKNPDTDADRMDWRITLDSYIVNNLGVDLTDCYLIHPLFDINGPGGLHRDRGTEIYAYPIGDLPSNGKRVPLAPRCYQVEQGESVFKKMKQLTLARRQRSWSGSLRSIVESVGYGKRPESFASLDETKYALLLASTIGEYNASRDTTMATHLMGATTWSRDRMRQLDLRENLESDCVYLFGFARDPGPVQLFKSDLGRDYARVAPDGAFSQTMYRVRIGVTISGEKPGEQEDPNQDTPT
ncbi:MAG: hypothetical protein ACE5E5_11005 [Phycisphaerae bacterium]